LRVHYKVYDVTVLWEFTTLPTCHTRKVWFVHAAIPETADILIHRL